jgi:hypothetical protein
VNRLLSHRRKRLHIREIRDNVDLQGNCALTVEEKRDALEQLLESRVLRRCDQLKKMLRFICEAEIEGRADELSEYLIGVEAFGRPSSYSPVEDSIVRTRAYELRNKLSRYYGSEVPHAPVRIDIERGAYVP